MSKPWSGLVKLLELKVTDLDGNVVFEKKDINNVLHYQGQELILSCMFGNSTPPSEYYVGLDSRTSITVNQNMTSLQGEPTTGGYVRQPLARGTNFVVTTVGTSTTSVKATSTTVTFTATGSSYTATDMFLCTSSSGSTGYLISTVAFGTTVTVSPSNQVSMKFAMQLGDC